MKTTPKTYSLLTLDYIKAWGAEWQISEDPLEWIIEAYAKSEDDSKVIRLMNRIANAQRTRLKNLPHLEQRRLIEWELG